MACSGSHRPDFLLLLLLYGPLASLDYDKRGKLLTWESEEGRPTALLPLPE